ncbi:hypothetical protein A2U04_05265 [Fusobacterium necrophorum subsp. funduliforme]|uniref:hypothetical protein n=1 Tax=Fusobacterium necrophorum TaxID=859 RepID=UPI000789220B|nr:hypothetical protein [Fusobacterium necrophorum]KYM48136.1 hypothetical protein A2U04_05265 [Fusobacterium necrophorum subsp. funduliforme]
MTRKKLEMRARKNNLVVRENGIEGVYELRFISSNAVLTKTRTLKELEEELKYHEEKIEAQEKGWA